jgi:hypothetical protein
MKLRFIVAIVALFTLIGLALAIAMIGPGSVFSRTSNGLPTISGVASTAAGNPIALENELLGTLKWEIPKSRVASIQIQAYASATSVTPGEKLTFFVSTEIGGTRYFVDIYRLGWYGGDGGRLMISQSGLRGQAQGYYDSNAHNLVNCNACHVDSSMGLVEANWQASYSLTIPADWTTGIYLAKFTDANGWETYAPFDVRGNAHATYIVATSDNTYQAYNDWGGYSLYEADSIAQTSESTASARGVEVSFDRPYTAGEGSGQVLSYEIDAIRWLERRGYDLSYASSVDLYQNPAQLLQHRAYLSIGHDEYWSKEMRDGVENARDHGVGLAFLGADPIYWQIRYQPDSAGVPDRTIVCYKVETASNDLARDPYYGKDNSRVTSQWRDPVIGRPENALVGIMFSDLTHKRQGFAWQVSAQPKSPLLQGTGLQPAGTYGCDLVGYEWDKVFANGATPPGLQVLSVSHTVNDGGRADVGNTAYYKAKSGAMVFATGSMNWTYALDDYRFTQDPACSAQSHAEPGIQKLMTNVMAAIVIHHPS